MPETPPTPPPEQLPQNPAAATSWAMRFVATLSPAQVITLLFVAILMLFGWQVINTINGAKELPTLLTQLGASREQALRDHADAREVKLQAFFAAREDSRQKHDAEERAKDRAMVNQLAGEYTRWRETIMPFLVPALKKVGVAIPLECEWFPVVAPMPRPKMADTATGSAGG